MAELAIGGPSKGPKVTRIYVSTLLLDCVPVFCEIITPAYLK